MNPIEITIIGAGVIGLAAAERLSREGKQVVVLERHVRFGQETSSRNSEVIHSGLYYPLGSLKAELCVRGRDLLYAFCQDHGIAHRRLGKLIVAADEAEVRVLEQLAANGANNRIPGLEWLTSRDIRRMEPSVTAQAALLSPDTGIVDSHAMLAALERRAIAQGAILAYGTEVTGISPVPGGFRVLTRPETHSLESAYVINGAGLSSDRVAAMAGIDIDHAGYRLHWCKGDYFRSRKPLPISHLVYPVPSEHTQTLGIHLTLDQNGRARFGPDAEFVSELAYDIDAGKRERFAQAIRRYLPFLTAADLDPDTSGIRPKLQGPGEGFRDFIIREESDRGLPGFINCIGIESPGLTAALAIAERVAGMTGSAMV